MRSTPPNDKLSRAAESVNRECGLGSTISIGSGDWLGNVVTLSCDLFL